MCVYCPYYSVIGKQDGLWTKLLGLIFTRERDKTESVEKGLGLLIVAYFLTDL